MPRYYAEAEKTTNELEQMFIDEISMQKDIKVISLMQTLGHKALSIIKRNATANVQEVRHGKWIPSRDKNGTYEEVCSECGYIEQYNIDPDNDKHPNCCPNCGAIMSGENKGDE